MIEMTGHPGWPALFFLACTFWCSSQGHSMPQFSGPWCTWGWKSLTRPSLLQHLFLVGAQFATTPPVPIRILYPGFPSACSVRNDQWSTRALAPEKTLCSYCLYLNIIPPRTSRFINMLILSLCEKRGPEIFVSLLVHFIFILKVLFS